MVGKVKLLKSEIDKWVKNKIITQAIANEILEFYPSRNKEKNNSSILITIFCIFGAILIGAGIISILGHNWENMDRKMRAFISFMPLVLSQIFMGFVLIKNIKSSLIKEISGIFLQLSIAISIALIGQTYHMPGDLNAFLFIWMVLTIPIFYIVESKIVLSFYYIGICYWAGYTQHEGSSALYYWPLFLATVPRLYKVFKNKEKTNREFFILWIASISGIVGISLSLEKALPGLWIVIFSAFFSCLYLIGLKEEERYKENLKKPFTVVGLCGIFALSQTVINFRFWEKIGFDDFRTGLEYSKSASYIDYFLCIFLIIVSIIFITKEILKKNVIKVILGSISILGIIAFLFEDLGSVIFRIYFLILLIVAGTHIIRKNKPKYLFLLFIITITYIFNSYYRLKYFRLREITEFSEFIYIIFLSVFYLATRAYYDQYEKKKFKALKTICVILLLNHIYFYKDIIDLSEARDVLVFTDYIFIILLLTFGGFFVKKSLENKKYFPLVVASLPIFYIIQIIINDKLFIMMNLYLIILGISLIFDGFVNKSTKYINIGVIFLAIVLIIRFFNSDMSFVAKGSMFLIIGIGFFIINLFILKFIGGDSNEELKQ